MAGRIDVFYAFPSHPPSLGDTINRALKELGQSAIARQANVRFKPWTEMGIVGKQLIHTITQNIERAEVFACDLTYHSPNVTFELGYAIGQFKRVWLSLDTSIHAAPREYKRVYSGLLGLGYAEYQNHVDLVNAFFNNSPWADLDQTLLGDVYRVQTARQELPTILYLKPPLDTDAVILTGEALRASVFAESLCIDDPTENPSPSLEWYAGKIRTADAVLVHLLGSEHHSYHSHNVKCSIVAGLAHSFGKPLLMLAHTPFETPIDYQHLLKTHDTARRCDSLVRGWLDEQTPALPRRRPRRPPQASSVAPTLDLRALSIGEPVAEHERLQLDTYFLETSAYFRALEGATTICVGRRGTGKTANLYAMRTALAGDKRNHVCVVTPVGYEMDGLIRVLEENIHRSERGYLIESLWKFLIYSELACSVFHELSSRPTYRAQNSAEDKFLEYFQSNHDALSIPFSERLDRAMKSLVGLATLSEARAQRARISELLHSQQLRILRQLLGLVLANRQKVAILIDDLDKPWGPGHHIGHLSELLLGLLRVAEDIGEEFRRQDYWRKRVNVSVTMFLRSDIFAFIQPLAAEQDKLPIQRIVWDDPELLLRVLDQRLEHTVPRKLDAQEIRMQLFPSEVVGVPTSEFVTRTVLPRPRDVIYLVSEAIGGAVNRGHKTVTAADFLEARKRYSNWIFKSILSEDDPSKGKLEDILYEFAGAPRVNKLSEVVSRIEKAGVGESDIEFYIDLLCDVGFFRIETADGFRNPRHEGERQIMRQVARKLAINVGKGAESYEVNSAFYQVLQIE